MHKHWWDLLLQYWHVIDNFVPYVIGGAGAAGGTTLLQRMRQRRAAAWPSADGEVRYVSMKRKKGYTATVGYRYYARSEYHEGKYSRQFRRKEHAEQFTEALRGRHIQVRYKEDKPGVSVVLEDDLRMTGALQVS